MVLRWLSTLALVLVWLASSLYSTSHAHSSHLHSDLPKWLEVPLRDCSLHLSHPPWHHHLDPLGHEGTCLYRCLHTGCAANRLFLVAHHQDEDLQFWPMGTRSHLHGVVQRYEERRGREAPTAHLNSNTVLPIIPFPSFPLDKPSIHTPARTARALPVLGQWMCSVSIESLLHEPCQSWYVSFDIVQLSQCKYWMVITLS